MKQIRIAIARILVMAWNDANIRSRDAENEALKRLVAACRFDVFKTPPPAKMLFWDEPDRTFSLLSVLQWIARDGSSFYFVHSNSRGNFADQYYRMNLQKMALCWLPTRTP